MISEPIDRFYIVLMIHSLIRNAFVLFYYNEFCEEYQDCWFIFIFLSSVNFFACKYSLDDHTHAWSLLVYLPLLLMVLCHCLWIAKTAWNSVDHPWFCCLLRAIFTPLPANDGYAGSVRFMLDHVFVLTLMSIDAAINQPKVAFWFAKFQRFFDFHQAWSQSIFILLMNQRFHVEVAFSNQSLFILGLSDIVWLTDDWTDVLVNFRSLQSIFLSIS